MKKFINQNITHHKSLRHRDHKWYVIMINSIQLLYENKIINRIFFWIKENKYQKRIQINIIDNTLYDDYKI